MLGMMASLKSEARPNLYFNKYKYRASIIVQNLRFTHITETFEQFLMFIKQESEVARTRYWHRAVVPNSPAQLDRIRNTIEYRNRVQAIKGVTIRKEYDSISFYSNDLDLLKEVWTFSPKSCISEVILMPAGVMTFAKEPIYQYRTYLVNRKIESNSKEEFFDFVKRTPVVEPSGSLDHWLKRPSRYSHDYSSDKYFISYDDPGILTMLGLICPEIIGKSYKLEKRYD